MSNNDVGEAANNARMPRWAYIMFIILGPALVAGLFSLAPTLYSELIKNREVLQYSVLRGPSIEQSGRYQTIFSVNVNNIGKVRLTKVQLYVRTDAGQFEAIVSSQGVIKPAIENRGKEAVVNVEALLSGDAFTVSASVLSDVANPEFNFDVRSEQIIGIIDNDPSKTASKDFDRLALLAAGLVTASVAIMTFLFTRVISRGAVGKILGDYQAKDEYIGLVLGLTGIVDLKDILQIHKQELSYIAAANMLLIAGRNSEVVNRRKCVRGLQALLLVHRIAPESKEKIIENIMALDPDVTPAACMVLLEDAKDMSGVDVRRAILSFFDVI